MNGVQHGDILDRLTRAQRQLDAVNEEAGRLRAHRAALVSEAARTGISNYRIAQTLNVAQTTVAAILKRA